MGEEMKKRKKEEKIKMRDIEEKGIQYENTNQKFKPLSNSGRKKRLSLSKDQQCVSNE